MNIEPHEIDLRSDTVTKPSEAMRRAMYEAEVADDTYDGDPTVRRLQQLATEKTGMEAALFVASGTMGNLLGVLVNTQPGQEVIVGEESHQYLWEVGGIARIANCVTHPVPFHRGLLEPDEVEAAVRTNARESAATGLVCVENTSNFGGGAVVPPERVARIAEVARRHHLAVHMDGARFFHAVVACGQPATSFTRNLDTLAFCLSKGLGAPFGGLLCGRRETIELAIHYRQMLGGGMRQAGVMAAAGVVALQTGIERLADDHANAKKLAHGLAERFPGCCDPSLVETNMCPVDCLALGVTRTRLAAYLATKGIIIFGGENQRMRLTTHCMITAEDIDAVLQAFDGMRAAI